VGDRRRFLPMVFPEKNRQRAGQNEKTDDAPENINVFARYIFGSRL
jgi:hypothetical protein